MERSTPEKLYDAGKFRDALAVSDAAPRPDDVRANILRAELLQHLGRDDEARRLLDRVVSAYSVDETDLSRAHLVYSRIASEFGDFDAKLKHLRKSVFHAERCGDLRRLCWGQLWLLALLADRTGQEAAQALLDSLRSNVIKLGEPPISAALHLFIAELDGKRGLTANALRHTRLARSLLAQSPHLWLESWVQNNFLALHLIRCDFEEAAEHGKLALTASTACGSVSSIRRCFGNLGRLNLIVGHFDKSLDYVEKACNYSSHDNEHRNAVRDTMARVFMARGEYGRSLELVDQIDASVRQDTGAGRYVHRHSLLTKAEVLSRLGRTLESLKCLERIIELAGRAGERGLMTQASLLKIEVETLGGLTPSKLPDMCDIAPSTDGDFVVLHAMYERTMATLMAAEGNNVASEMHFHRAQRIYQALRNCPELIEAERSVSLARNKIATVTTERAVFNSINDTTAVLLHAGRPELMATDLVALLQTLDGVTGCVAVATDGSGQETTLGGFGKVAREEPGSTFRLGAAHGREVEIRVAADAALEARAALNSVALLLRTCQELERAKAEREQKLAVWPLDDKPAGSDSVLLGEMQSLMSTARRVAQTTISVLITGESGTGKEVLARAVHNFSPRAKRPFIPFNCTAIPRELLESQLFGYRRGAFTGADRDSPGLIRAAKDGTLFLDEIGELSLELQPKLLRFLESGEIHPLGDSAPFSVDVRIVAATNADLSKLVQEGRFREDLYYRLDVVKLEIPPLRERRDEIPALAHHFIARAATEFRKGRVRIAEETMEQLLLYPWPGNVRQLQNEMRRMVAMADSDAVLGPEALLRDIRDETKQRDKRRPSPNEFSIPLNEKLAPAVARIERELIKAALQANDGRLEATAKALGISRKGLYLKRQRLGV